MDSIYTWSFTFIRLFCNFGISMDAVDYLWKLLGVSEMDWNFNIDKITTWRVAMYSVKAVSSVNIVNNYIFCYQLFSQTSRGSRITKIIIFDIGLSSQSPKCMDFQFTENCKTLHWPINEKYLSYLLLILANQAVEWKEA